MSQVDSRPAGRQVRSIALHALAAAFMCISPLLVFVPAAYISAGLRNGRKGAAGAIAGSAVLLILFSMMRSTSVALAGHVGEIAGLLLALGIPSLIAVVLMRRGAGFGEVMVAVVVSSVAGLFLTELLMQLAFGLSPYAALKANFQQQTQATMEFYRKLGMSEERLQETVKVSAGMIQSFLVLMLEGLLVTIFALSLMMVARLPSGRVTGSRFLLRNFALPDALLFVFVASGVSPLFGGLPRIVGLNVLGVTVLLYALQGLGVFRSMLLRIGFGIPGTLMALVIVFLMIPFSIGALFLVGLFDPFFDFRKLKRKDDSDEGHTV